MARFSLYILILTFLFGCSFVYSTSVFDKLVDFANSRINFIHTPLLGNITNEASATLQPNATSADNFHPGPGLPNFYPGKQFEPNIFNMNCAFGQFALCCTIASLVTYIWGRKLSWIWLLIFWWFAFDAAIHTIMEGSFVYISLLNRFDGGAAAASDSHWFFTCVWTEYGKADYRWLYGDPNIVGLELVTVFVEAPLCWFMLYAILKDSNWKHQAQIIICLGEVYGLYEAFVPEWIYGSPNLDGSSFLFKWIYLGSNIPWLIIPCALIVQSCFTIAEAFQKNKVPNADQDLRSQQVG